MKAETNQPPTHTKGKALETAIAPTNGPAAAKATSANTRIPYICGPITSMDPPQDLAHNMFHQLADLCEKVFGHRGWVPHEHLTNIDDLSACELVRRQVANCTSIMLVWAPPQTQSWGGGIAMEMAFNFGVPVILFWHPDGFKPSPQLLGHPSIRAKINLNPYWTLPNEAEDILRQAMRYNHILLNGGEVVTTEPPRA